ncbi:MAG: hypothetical protein ACLP5O_09120 [Acidimicrobiales bacterium]
MAYTITDIAELVRYHFVFSEPDDERADANLAQLVQQLEQMASRPLWREASWVFCDRCGCSVDTDLMHPDGHHYADDGDFYCADCWTLGRASQRSRSRMS